MIPSLKLLGQLSGMSLLELEGIKSSLEKVRFSDEVMRAKKDTFVRELNNQILKKQLTYLEEIN